MRILQIIGAVLVFFASPAMAKDTVAAWTVMQKSGDVRVIRNGMQPASVNLRAALSPGDIVATGLDGRAMLTKGEDYVVVAPGSRLVLPKEQQKTGFTRLIQQLGTTLYKVKRTGVPHFEVETPMLAAVVKGTTFTVVVDQRGAAVQVTEGVVEVSSLTGSAKRLVEGGLAVYVGRERPNEIIEIKTHAIPLPVAGQESGESVQIDGSGDVSLTTITNLTDGLVREAPTATALPATSKIVAAPVGSPTSTVATPLGDLTEDVIADDAPVTDLVEAIVPGDTGSVVGLVETAVPAITAPVIEVTQTTGPAVIQPLVDIVQTAAPALTQPVVDIVQATVPVVTQPVVEIVQATVPVVTQPVVEIVQAIVPVVTQPVVEIVQTTVPAITQPVIQTVQTTVPAITQPVIQTVQTTVPIVTQPVIQTVQTTVPAITQPVIQTVQTTVPQITQPVVNVVATVPNILCTLLCGR